MTEVGWLIETDLRGRAMWWTGRTLQPDGTHWTTDPNEAIRFTRKEDAQRVIDRLPIQPARAIEHMWIDP